MSTSTATSEQVEEQILVVPTAEFHELGHFQGFSTDVERYLDPLLNSNELSYKPRGPMEEDPSFKQLIPYVLFTFTDPSGTVHLFNYQRGGGGGEARLRAKRSIGVGGHISSLDHAEDTTDIYRQGLERELSEEVSIETEYTEARVGLINDDETEVGKVHLGVVHRFDLSEPKVSPREDDLADACFKPLEEVLAEIDQYETWSQIALRALFA